MDEITDLAVAEKREILQSRPPEQVLEEARRAANHLQQIIAKKPKPVIIRGKQYLEFEDWAMIAKFYGVVAKVTDSKYVQHGEAKGFESTAIAFHVASGQEISQGFGMCMSDEEVKPGETRASWSLQRLRSFSQTRACAKALKNVFSWVAVLGGYAAQPAEDMENDAIEPHDGETKVSPRDMVAQITNMIGAMCGGDQEKMNAMLKEATKWKKKDGTEGWLTFDSLPSQIQSRPDWIARIHGNVSRIYSTKPKGEPNASN